MKKIIFIYLLLTTILVTNIQALAAESTASTFAPNTPFSQTTSYEIGTLGAKAHQTISVQDAPFSAVGDGVHDDTTAIQAAINYAATLAHGATIHYPAGRYLISSTLIQTKPFIRHVGDGITTTLLVTKTDIATLIIGSNPITALSGVDILDMGFYHTNSVPKTHPHLTLLSPIQTTIRTWFQNGAFGVVQYGGQGVTYDKVYAPGDFEPKKNPTLNSAQAISLYAASTLQGNTLGAGAVELPTETNFHDIYVNGPNMAGWKYGVAIFAGEHTTFSGDYYIGQSTVNNIHIEQDSNNKLILETKLERGGYIDAAGDAAIWIGGPKGNGTQYIGSVNIDSDIKGQAGTGKKGIYIDGTNRPGTFTQAVRNLSITSHVSGFASNGIELSGGINMSVTGAQVWGNSFNAINNGVGMAIGPNVSGLIVTGGHFGGGTFGDLTLGSQFQTYGISVDPQAKNITINGVDLRGNSIGSLNWTPNSAISGNWIVNCPGYNENRTAVTLPMAASGQEFINPFGAPAQLLIYGGVVTSIKINGSQMFSTTVNSPITLNAHDRVNVTFSSTPTWKWWPQ